jgi:hypothetical protein
MGGSSDNENSGKGMYGCKSLSLSAVPQVCDTIKKEIHEP